MRISDWSSDVCSSDLQAVLDDNGVATGKYVSQEADGKYYDVTFDTAGAGTLSAEESTSIVITDKTSNPLEAVDKALAEVDALRSQPGAVQNRFESTIPKLNNTKNGRASGRASGGQEG